MDRRKILSPTPLPQDSSWQELMAEAIKGISPLKARDKTVVMVCNSLCYGGAERQLVNLALGFRTKGWKVFYLSIMQGEDSPAYVHSLQAAGIQMAHIKDAYKPKGSEEGAQIFWKDFLSRQQPEVQAALTAAPPAFGHRIAGTMSFLQKKRPSLVIAYLDWASVIAGMAGLLTGIPHLILSARMASPPRFPHFFAHITPAFHQAYTLLAAHKNVHLVANSTYAAHDYAAWLHLPKDKIEVIPNGLDRSFMRKPLDSERIQERRRLGFAPDSQVILGLFRLSTEKRPKTFIKIVETLLPEFPSLRALICGDGPLREELETYARKKKLNDRIIFLGAREDVRKIIIASDILLHCSSSESMPNVLLEAQALGKAVVCTRVGGVADALAPELLPYSFPPSNTSGMKDALRILLKRKALRQKLASAAQPYVRQKFSITTLVRHYLKQMG